jgi:ferredoxin
MRLLLYLRLPVRVPTRRRDRTAKARHESKSRSLRACGICAAFCPANAILFHGKAARSGRSRKTAEAFGALRENSAALAAGGGVFRPRRTCGNRPCGGYLNEARLAEALSSCDGVQAAVCVAEACRHFDGNRSAHCRKAPERAARTDGSGFIQGGLRGGIPRYAECAQAAAERMLRPGRRGNHDRCAAKAD